MYNKKDNQIKFKKAYVGLASSASMFPSIPAPGVGTLSYCDIEAEDVKALLHGYSFISCCNPSHQVTLSSLRLNFEIEVEIPQVAPVINLQEGDILLVLQVTGLPRLGNDRHEYTKEEIEGKGKFRFTLLSLNSPSVSGCPKGVETCGI